MKIWTRMAWAAAAAATVPTAFAQTTGGLEEVVVTARKTAESLQDVPLAITALSAEDMQKRQIQDLSDIAKLTPGLNFESYLGGNGTPVIRGAAQQRVQDLDQNVSAFFDGIYLPRQYVVSPGVIGLERVEVVKGPQSALYGRNAFMGAINYVSKKPGDDLKGQVDATAGGDKRWDVLAELSGPIVPGKLFGRVGYGRSEFDGDATNSHPRANDGPRQGSPGKLGGWRNQSYQARLVFKPIDSLELDAGYYHFDVFAETPPVVRYQSSTADMNCGALRPSGNRSFYCGELDYRFRPLAGGGPNAESVVDPRGYGLDMASNLIRGHAEWTATDSLKLVYEYGHLTANAIGGAGSDRDPVLGSVNAANPTGPRVNVFQVTPVGNFNYRSNEVRVQYRPVQSIDLMAGYFTSKLADFDTFVINSTMPLLGTAAYDITSPGWLILTRGTTTVDANGVFGSVAWRATDRLRLGVEARHAKEEKTLVNGPTSLSTVVRTLKGDWSQFTPRGTVDYKLTNRNMLYATVAKGAKSGGFNLSAIVPSQFEFAPDENWTYEIGSKNELFGGTVRLNVAAFVVNWSNQQVSCSALGGTATTTPPAVICNLGKAKIKGLEADATWLPIDGLTLTAGLSYNKATYGDGVIDERIRDFRLCDNVTCPASGAIGGNQLMRQSKVQGQFGADYEWPLGTLRAFVGGDTSYKSKQYSDTMNLAYLPARTLVNLRAGVRTEHWDVTAWAKNALDEHYATAAFAIVGADPQFTPVQGQQRTWGVTGRYRFGAE